MRVPKAALLPGILLVLWVGRVAVRAVLRLRPGRRREPTHRPLPPAAVCDANGTPPPTAKPQAAEVPVTREWRRQMSKMSRVIAAASVVLAVSLSVVAGTTFAWFSDTAKATQISFSTGNASLCLAADSDAVEAGVWHCDGTVAAADLGLSFPQSIYPGFEEAVGELWLGNRSTSQIGLNVKAGLKSCQIDPGEAGSVVFLKMTWDGNDEGTGWGSLNWWCSYSAPLFPGPLEANESARVLLLVKMAPTAGNEYAGGSMSMDIQFDAEQVQ